jgi:lysophospholipase L1-like esterase
LGGGRGTLKHCDTKVISSQERFPDQPILEMSAKERSMTMLLSLVLATLAAVAQSAEDPWEKAIAEFEAADKDSPPRRDGVVFIGSSSIRLWNTKDAFPDLPSVNRGFGGSHLADSVRFADRIITPYEPRIVVVFAGGNDIAAGKSPEQVADDFKALTAKIHAKLPKTKIYYISLFPTVQRWKMDNKFRESNRLIEAYSKTDDRLGYLDMRTKMTADDGGPRPALLRADGLHMNEQGYAIWSEVIGPVLRTEFKKSNVGPRPATKKVPALSGK